MKRGLIVWVSLTCLWVGMAPSYGAPSPGSIEKRCGWLSNLTPDNPTPVNRWLIDKDGLWTISVQGATAAIGLDRLPAFDPQNFQAHVGSYACTCLDVTTDLEAKQIATIHRVAPLPLSTCEQDPLLLSVSDGLEKRCGWLENPTPANLWLTDKDGLWIISVQGGYRAIGIDTIPEFDYTQYVKTNGFYGYACTCLDVFTNPEEMRIGLIQKMEQLPLAICQQDPSLPAAID